MGILRSQDKIGTLSHSAGNILMAASASNPAYLTVGGRQFKITSQLSVALPAMTAATRYQVFAVQSGGVVSLAISSNENSVGPTGYSSWKLVGSLYSSSTVFGNFVNIKGTPLSGWIDFPSVDAGILVTTSNNNGPTYGTVVTNKAQWRHVGDSMEIMWAYRQTTAGLEGTGIFLFNLPTGYSIDTTRAPVNTSTAVGAAFKDSLVGQFMTANLIGNVHVYSATQLKADMIVGVAASTGVNAWGAASGNSFVTAAMAFGINATVPTTSLSNTPIEDR